MSAPVATLKTQAESELAAHYAAARKEFGADLAARDAAFARFASAGLPHRRVESWHYTDLRARLRHAPPPAAMPDAAAAAAARAALGPATSATRIVLLDGWFQPGLSALGADNTQIKVTQSAARVDAAYSEGALGDPMAALNRAFAAPAIVIAVAPGARIEAAVEIVHLHSALSAVAAASALSITLGAGARVALTETRRRVGDAALWLNDLVSADIADGAHLTLVSLCGEALGETSQALLTLDARLGARAEFDCFGLITGGALVRRQLFVTMAGEHGRTGLRGLSLLRRAQHADTTLVVDHAAPHGVSREFFRHIVDERATGVFQGKIIVRPGAQKTDGGMKSNALLLAPDAAMMNKPELEIFADDVVCGHGATCGELDEDHLFYLMARGIARPEAEALLLEAFALEALEGVGDEALRAGLEKEIAVWLTARSPEEKRA